MRKPAEERAPSRAAFLKIEPFQRRLLHDQPPLVDLARDRLLLVGDSGLVSGFAGVDGSDHRVLPLFCLNSSSSCLSACIRMRHAAEQNSVGRPRPVVLITK